MAVLQCLIFVTLITITFQMQDSFYKGTEFGLAFFSSFHKSADHGLTNYIVIQAEEAGSCTIQYKALNDAQNTVVHHESFAAGDVIKVGVPESTQMSLISQISPKGISVSCSVSVVLFTLDRSRGDANVVHGIPTRSLSRDYYMPGVPDNAILGVVAMFDNTQVTIHLKTKCKYHFKGRDYSGSDTIHVTLNHLQIFSLSTAHVDNFGDEACDLAGTHVTASHNFVLYSGGSCTFFGNDMNPHTHGCDKLIIQVPPPERWGRDYLVSDMAGDDDGYRVRILASQDNTAVTVSAYNRSHSSHSHTHTTTHKTLGTGEFLTLSGLDEVYLVIQSSKPVLVVQFLIFDPLTLIVKPIEHYPIVNQFGSRYIFVTMENGLDVWNSDQTFMNLIVASGHTKSVRLDGQQLDKSISWKSFTKLGYSVTTVPLTHGTHMVDSLAPNTPCSVQVYGLSRSAGDAYGYTAVTSCSKRCTDLDLSSIMTEAQLKTGITQLIGQVGTDATENQCQGACQNSVLTIPRQACAKICPSFLYYKQKYYSE